MALAAVVVPGALADCGGTRRNELNILVMPGYEEDHIIKPFEEKFNIRVNAKIYPSSDQIFAILGAAKPGDWDVITPDTPWIEKLVATNLIVLLNPADYPLSEFYERWRDFDQCKVGGKTGRRGIGGYCRSAYMVCRPVRTGKRGRRGLPRDYVRMR